MSNDTEYKAKEPSDAPLKFILDKTVIPETLLMIDSQRVQNIEQTINQFFPDDNSIINSEVFEIGGKKVTRSIVQKDKYTFGFSKGTSHLKVQEQFGLVSYKPVGDDQFWLNFSDGETRMLIENVEAARNKQRMIEILPPEPTAEEIAAKEEAARLAAEAAKKKGGAA